MIDKIKVKVSFFVASILENDALRFGFMKNGKSNKNALLNKLIPTLVELRKAKREKIEDILKNEYSRKDSESIYNAVNTVIDRVYFNEAELNALDEYIWIRPSKETISVYDEIQRSETKITAQETSAYIRGLLNEYSLLPQYKREALTFDKEFDVFDDACFSQQILHFRDRETGERYRAFAFSYCYGYLYTQTNTCIIYDISNQTIKGLPLCRLQDAYIIKQKYKPSDRLILLLQEYSDNGDFEREIKVGGTEDVF